MADPDVSKPKEPPKPVHIGGETLVDRILPHIKKITIGAVVLAVVISFFVSVRCLKERGQEKRTEKVASVLAVAQRPVAAPGATPDPKKDEFADETARAKAVLDEISKQDADPPGHAYRAGQLLSAGQIDNAIAEYRQGIDDKGILGVLAREGLGIALEAKAAAEKDAAARQKLYEEALGSYQTMQPDEKGPRHIYALYHQGRMQAALGKTAEAKTLFEKANDLITTGQHIGLRELRELLTRRLAALGAG
jgi:tetratricopeptide (TPR) repeat protein